MNWTARAEGKAGAHGLVAHNVHRDTERERERDRVEERESVRVSKRGRERVEERERERVLSSSSVSWQCRAEREHEKVHTGGQQRLSNRETFHFHRWLRGRRAVTPRGENNGPRRLFFLKRKKKSLFLFGFLFKIGCWSRLRGFWEEQSHSEIMSSALTPGGLKHP